MKNRRLSYWWARIPVIIVFFFNVQCTMVFLFSPEQYAPSFELSGTTGRIVIQALGILFLMWNIPYFFALLNPVRNFTSLIEAVIMQLIGGLGESLLYITMDSTNITIRKSIERFMLFDWSGLVLLMIALVIAARMRGKNKEIAVSE